MFFHLPIPFNCTGIASMFLTCGFIDLTVISFPDFLSQNSIIQLDQLLEVQTKKVLAYAKQRSIIFREYN